jgi:hypothetical protein
MNPCGGAGICGQLLRHEPEIYAAGSTSGTSQKYMLALVAGVIGVAMQDRKSTVNLLQQHDTGQLVGEGHLPK